MHLDQSRVGGGADLDVGTRGDGSAHSHGGQETLCVLLDLAEGHDVPQPGGRAQGPFEVVVVLAELLKAGQLVGLVEMDVEISKARQDQLAFNVDRVGWCAVAVLDDRVNDTAADVDAQVPCLPRSVAPVIVYDATSAHALPLRGAASARSA